MKDFRKLKIWNRAVNFAIEIYRATEKFPKKEVYFLTDQVRQTSVSIFSNIAEGCKKDSDRESVRYCNISLGGNGELKSQSIFAERIGCLDKEKIKNLSGELCEIGKVSNGLIKSVRGER